MGKVPATVTGTGLITGMIKPVRAFHRSPQRQPHPTDFVRPLERETGIEPASLAWKARVLPLNYSRPGAPSRGLGPRESRTLSGLRETGAVVEGAGFEPAYSKRADLQSAAINHSATPPQRTREYTSSEVG